MKCRALHLSYRKDASTILITLSGIIGSGKSSLTEILSKELGTKAYYEPVEDNPVLPIFYKGNEIAAKKRAAGEKDATNPYAYLLQTYFLNRRFAMIKEAMKNDNNILDRSIYEDEIFMKMNTEMAHKKSPDLMITIKVSYETMIRRIIKRGRDYEQIEKDPSLVDYYHRLLSHYDDWMDEYDESPLLIIDGDKYDFVADVKDRVKILETIEDKLYDLGNLEQTKVDELRKAHLEILKQQ